MAGAVIPGLRGDYAARDGVRLHFRIGGDPAGFPVVLQHGWGGTGYAWRRVIPQLIDAGCAVLVPDLRGYGDSDKPAGATGYDGNSLAADLNTIVAESDFGQGRPLVVVGHDMGAPGTLLWAAAHPEKFAALIYVEEPLLRPSILRQVISYDDRAATTGSLWWWLFALAPGAPQALVVGREREYLTWFYQRTAASAAATADAVEEYLRTFHGEEGVLGAFGVYRGVPATAEQTEALVQERVRVPLVGVGGANSWGTAVADGLREAADEVETVVIPGGHFLPEEQPVKLAEVILRQVHARA